MFEFMNMNMTLFHGFTMFIFWAIFFYLLISIDTKEKPSLLDILKKRIIPQNVKTTFSKILFS